MRGAHMAPWCKRRLFVQQKPSTLQSYYNYHNPPNGTPCESAQFAHASMMAVGLPLLNAPSG